MKYKYIYEEYSQDTRKYEIESDKMLTEQEIQDIALSVPIVDGSTDEDKEEGYKVKFIGTEFGDDSQVNLSGSEVMEDK